MSLILTQPEQCRQKKVFFTFEKAFCTSGRCKMLFVCFHFFSRQSDTQTDWAMQKLNDECVWSWLSLSNADKIAWCTLWASHPTQSIIYVHFLVARFQEICYLSFSTILKILVRRIRCSQKSDPPHKVMRYWFYHSTWLSRSFPSDQSGLVDMICTS